MQSDPYKTETEPKALYFCAPIVNCDAQSSMSPSKPPVKQNRCIFCLTVSLIHAKEERALNIFIFF